MPVVEQHFKWRRLGIALTAIAGPLACFLMALFWIMMIHIILKLPLAKSHLITLISILISGIKVNTLIGLLHCLTLPSLDAANFIRILLPKTNCLLLCKIKALWSLDACIFNYQRCCATIDYAKLLQYFSLVTTMDAAIKAKCQESACRGNTNV